MFNYYSTSWLTATYSLPLAYSQIVWWSLTYPYTFATELLTSYWQFYSNSTETKSEESSVSSQPSVSELVSLPSVAEPVEVLALPPVTETVIQSFEAVETEPKAETFNDIEAEIQWDRIVKVSLKDLLPIQPEVEETPPPRLDNPKRVLKLLQSLAIAKSEDINKLTLDRTKSLAKALGITQSVNGQKKKATVLKQEVQDKLKVFNLLEA